VRLSPLVTSATNWRIVLARIINEYEAYGGIGTGKKNGSIGAPVIFGRCPSLSANESESMLRTYLVCREKQERERNK
jgi:hypothetical protein